MIIVQVSENKIENSQMMQELNNFLQQEGHSETELHKEYVENAKADLATWIGVGLAGVGAFYPILKDVINWARPKKYSISITDGTITTSAKDLTIEEFLEVTKKLKKDNIKVLVNK